MASSSSKKYIFIFFFLFFWAIQGKTKPKLDDFLIAVYNATNDMGFPKTMVQHLNDEIRMITESVNNNRYKRNLNNLLDNLNLVASYSDEIPYINDNDAGDAWYLTFRVMECQNGDCYTESYSELNNQTILNNMINRKSKMIRPKSRKNKKMKNKNPDIKQYLVLYENPDTKKKYNIGNLVDQQKLKFLNKKSKIAPEYNENDDQNSMHNYTITSIRNRNASKLHKQAGLSDGNQLLRKKLHEIFNFEFNELVNHRKINKEKLNSKYGRRESKKHSHHNNDTNDTNLIRIYQKHKLHRHQNNHAPFEYEIIENNDSDNEYATTTDTTDMLKDQIDILRNDLSHEANYKLSRIEQENMENQQSNRTSSSSSLSFFSNLPLLFSHFTHEKLSPSGESKSSPFILLTSRTEKKTKYDNGNESLEAANTTNANVTNNHNNSLNNNKSNSTSNNNGCNVDLKSMNQTENHKINKTESDNNKTNNNNSTSSSNIDDNLRFYRHYNSHKNHDRRRHRHQHHHNRHRLHRKHHFSTKRSPDPVKEIKLKVSNRLISKGLGPSLPSDAFENIDSLKLSSNSQLKDTNINNNNNNDSINIDSSDENEKINFNTHIWKKSPEANFHLDNLKRVKRSRMIPKRKITSRTGRKLLEDTTVTDYEYIEDEDDDKTDKFPEEKNETIPSPLTDDKLIEDDDNDYSTSDNDKNEASIIQYKFNPNQKYDEFIDRNRFNKNSNDQYSYLFTEPAIDINKLFNIYENIDKNNDLLLNDAAAQLFGLMGRNEMKNLTTNSTKRTNSSLKNILLKPITAIKSLSTSAPLVRINTKLGGTTTTTSKTPTTSNCAIKASSSASTAFPISNIKTTNSNSSNNYEIYDNNKKMNMNNNNSNNESVSNKILSILNINKNKIINNSNEISKNSTGINSSGSGGGGVNVKFNISIDATILSNDTKLQNLQSLKYNRTLKGNQIKEIVAINEDNNSNNDDDDDNDDYNNSNYCGCSNNNENDYDDIENDNNDKADEAMRTIEFDNAINENDERLKRGIFFPLIPSELKRRTQQDVRDLMINANEDDFSIDELISGKVPSQIINSVFELAEMNPNFRSNILPGLCSYGISYPKGSNGLNTIRNKENQDQVHHTEQMLRQAMETINAIIEQQVRTRTCITLNEDLQDFYDLVMEARKENEHTVKFNERKRKIRRNRQKELQNFNNNGQSTKNETENNPKDTHRIFKRGLFGKKSPFDKHYDTVRKLMKIYNDLSKEDQLKAIPIRDMLMTHASFLKGIEYHQGRSQRNRRESLLNMKNDEIRRNCIDSDLITWQFKKLIQSASIVCKNALSCDTYDENDESNLSNLLNDYGITLD